MYDRQRLYILDREVDAYVKFFTLNPNIHALSIGFDYINNFGLRFVEPGEKFDPLYDKCSLVKKFERQRVDATLSKTTRHVQKNSYSLLNIFTYLTVSTIFQQKRFFTSV